MLLVGLIPFLFWLKLFLVLSSRQQNGGVRDAAITSALITACWATFGTELLSTCGQLRFWPVFLWWTIPTICLFCQLPWKLPTVAWPPLKNRQLIFIILATGLILAITFVGAVATPPNNCDSLGYHLPRQVFWMQHGDVAGFPVVNQRQITMPPFAEFVDVNLFILSGSDRWLNLVQWFALVLTALTASLIAREMECNSLMQALSALLVVSIPTAALQAENTKNDIVAAFFLCVMGYLGMRAVTKRNCSPSQILLIGIALGLLLLTKGTGLIFGLPLCLWVGAALWSLTGWRAALANGLLICLAALSLNIGHFTRNFLAFGSPIGLPESAGGIPLSNTRHDGKALVSNLLRNISMHLALPLPAWNSAVSNQIYTAHQILKIDLNDPEITFDASAPFTVSADFADEDRATAPAHVGLALMTVGILAIRGFRERKIWFLTFSWIPSSRLSSFALS
jgi:hypothetical protein